MYTKDAEYCIALACSSVKVSSLLSLLSLLFVDEGLIAGEDRVKGRQARGTGLRVALHPARACLLLARGAVSSFLGPFGLVVPSGRSGALRPRGLRPFGLRLVGVEATKVSVEPLGA
jgi:hypothetical protein